jgi:peptidoglycan/xylan/chitin deacetylase (PgdA/CDA1 family)
MTRYKQLNIIMYHYIRPIKNSKFSKIKGLEVSGFKKQLDYLSKKYNFITAEQLIAYSLGEDNLPQKSCYLTFDDGFKDHINYVMPELLNRKIQGSFFPSAASIENAKLLDVHAIHFILASINDYKKIVSELNIMCAEFGYTKSDLNLFKKIYRVQGKYDSAEIIYIKNMLQHVLPKSSRSIIISHFFKKYLGQDMNQFAKELYMSIPDIKKLIENGMYVGSHGYSHEWLDKLKKTQIKKEIELSLKFLKKVGASIKNWIMCYPFGEYNQDVIDILKSKNCAIGLIGKSGTANLDPKKMLVLNRFDTNDYPQ